MRDKAHEAGDEPHGDMTVDQQGVWDMCEAIEQRMAEASVEHTMSAMTPGPCQHEKWHGDDMTERSPKVGCRIATINSAKKLLSNMEHLEEITRLMEQESLDIQIITEPGRACSIERYGSRDRIWG